MPRRVIAIIVLVLLALVGFTVWQYKNGGRQDGGQSIQLNINNDPPVIIYAKSSSSRFGDKGTVFLARLDGSKRAIQETPSYQSIAPLFVSAKGDKIFYTIGLNVQENETSNPPPVDPFLIDSIFLIDAIKGTLQQVEDRVWLPEIISSDGEKLAYAKYSHFSNEGEVRVANIDGSKDKHVIDLPFPASDFFPLMGWSEDKEKLYLWGGGSAGKYGAREYMRGIYAINLKNKEFQLLESYSDDFLLGDLTRTPDGSKVIYVTNHYPADGGTNIRSTMSTLDLGTGEIDKIIKDSSKIGNILISPDSQKVVYDIRDSSTIYYLDLETKDIKEVALTKAPKTIGGWIDNDTVMLLEYIKDESATKLYAIKIDGTDKKLIDKAPMIQFIGVWPKNN